MILKSLCQLLTLALQTDRYKAVIVKHADLHLLSIINVIHVSAS